jgi:anti-sigma regulatory factor (Ser/Thr protein kinase)
MTAGATSSLAPKAFEHEALLYSGDSEFLDRTLEFSRDGLAEDEPTLVMVAGPKIDLLRAALESDRDAIHFADMTRVGKNPARIIPAWQDFVFEHTVEGRRMRGIGEPIWAGRTAAELVECQRHESLLNLAFADAPPFLLLCPYDTSNLDPAVLAEAECSHPFIAEGGAHRSSALCRDLSSIRAPFDVPLPEPEAGFEEFAFAGADSLGDVRQFVAARAANIGWHPAQTADLVLSVHEVATNSVRHGGGAGVLRLWHTEDRLVCEVQDAGLIESPMAGRARPDSVQPSGRGLWIANQLCDLVQVRSSASGSTVRLHMERNTNG